MQRRRVLVVLATLAVLLLTMLLLGVVGDTPPTRVRNEAPARSPAPVLDRESAAASPAASDGTRVPVDAAPPSGVELVCAVYRGLALPLPGAVVDVGVHGEGNPTQNHRITADAQGVARFTVAVATATTVTFAAGSPDLWGRPVSLLLQPGWAPPPVRLNLYPLDAEVRGVVTDLADRPLPEARVSWFRGLPAQACDAEGRFALRVSSIVDSFRCVFLAPGHRSARESVVLTPGSRVELRVRLEAGPRIHGRVSTVDGRPVIGARVETIVQRICGEFATTDQDGRYAIECLMPGRDTEQVAAACPGFVPTSARVATTNGDAARNFTMQAAGTVRGRVLRPDGRPAAGAVVNNGADRVFGDAHEETTADANGAFVLDELAPGICELVAHGEGFPPATTNVTVLVGQDVATTIALSAGATARGTVVDDVGQPVRGAWVMHASAHVATDDQGRFELMGLALDASTVDVMENEHVTLRAAPLAATGDNRFVLARAGTLRGRVVDARTGTGLDDFTVAFVGGDHQQGSLGVDWSRDGGRRFRGTAGLWQARGLALTPGSVWRVRVTAPGYAAAVRTLVAAVSPTAESDQLALTAGVRVHGRLVAARSGAPLAGGALRLLDHAPGERVFERYEPRTSSADDGTFAFTAVAAGQAWIEIVASGTPPRTAGPFAVGAEDLGLGELRVGDGACVAGTLRHEQGQPIANVELHAQSVHADATMPTHLQARTRADGGFAFAGLQPGTWRLYTSIATTAGTLVIDQRVQLDGTDRTLDLQPAGRGIVRGEVRGTWPAAASPHVTVRSADPAAGGPQHAFSTSATVQHGRFCLRGLPPGRYVVLAMLQDGIKRPRFAGTAEPVVVTDEQIATVVLDLGQR